MASGGMGDVLTGLLTALLSQGFSALESCLIGCYVHGVCGQELAASGHRQVTASEVMVRLSSVMDQLTRKY